MVGIRLENIAKRFGSAPVLEGIDLSIAPGELFFLIGPSGCGKSTLLRLIAGLLAPTSGRIWFGDRDVTALPTERRNAVMVFQSYALWPHMTVRENVAFGLRVRGLPRAERDRRIAESLELVRLADLAERRPNQLSGGQQQRVALARALAVRPDCLLLDEPLSNLDAALRQEMRGEIRRICKVGGLTTVYVTHDQSEAVSVADRIAVMNAGRIVQVDSPTGLYDHPRDVFTAKFLGEANILNGVVAGETDGLLRIRTDVGEITTRGRGAGGERVTLSIRPERLRPVPPDDDGDCAVNRLTGRVAETVFLGDAARHVLEIGSQRIVVRTAPPIERSPDTMTVRFRPEDAVVLRDSTPADDDTAD